MVALKMLNVYVPKETKEGLRELAKKNDNSMGQLVRVAIQEKYGNFKEKTDNG